MRHLWNLVCAALILLPLTCAQADPASWSLHFHAGTNIQGGAGAWFGVSPITTDNYDPPTSDIYAPTDEVAWSGYDMYCATYHDSSTDGGTWTGPSGFYWIDFRSPIALVPRQSKTWTWYVWGTPSFPTLTDVMGLSWTSYSDPSFRFLLTLQSKPAGITGGPAVGTVYDLSAGPGDVMLPVFRTTNGLDGYVFDFTATVVPEPSSLAALAFGLLPIGGLALRRRRHA